MDPRVATGVVKFWRPEKGWGAISVPDLPPGEDAWAHFSAIIGAPKRLEAGQAVTFGYVPASQDSFNYRAEWIRPA